MLYGVGVTWRHLIMELIDIFGVFLGICLLGSGWAAISHDVQLTPLSQ
jgi:hypothetical protein